MIDTITYGLTKDSPHGPIIRPEEQSPIDLCGDIEDDRPLTHGRLIGGLISLALLAGTGLYLVVAL